MNDDKPKSIWKKSWTGWGWLWAWLILAVATFFIVLIIGLLTPGGSQNLGATMASSAAISAVAIVFVGLLVFIHWLFCWRNFKRFLFGLACFVTLVALFYAEEDWRGWHAWNQFKHQWEARGEKFDFKDFVPPPVPDDQNFAMAPIWVESMKAVLGPTNSLQWFGSFAENGRTNFVDRLFMPLLDDYDSGPTNGAGNWQTGTVTDLKPWQDYYRSLAARTNLFPVTPQPQTPAQDVLLALSKYDSTIEELQRASRRPYSRFPLDYSRDDVWAILLPHLADLKRCSLVLRLRALAELQNGQINRAFDDVELALYSVNSIRTEPFLISHLVRIAMLQFTLQPVYEGLAEHKWSDAQLVELDSELAKLDFLADYKLAMRGERSCEVSAVEFIRHRNLRRFNDIFGNGGDRTQLSVAALLYYLCPGGWLDQNELHISRFYANWYLPLVNETERTVSPANLHAVDHAFDLELRHRTPENFLEPWLLPSLGRVVEKFAFAQESADLARVAVALERYRLTHGEYPESLDALAPQFLKKIPHAIIGGQPLRYRRTSDGQFVLYSVGWNETDDGGMVVINKSGVVDISRGDWVWRYPSK